MTGSGGPGPEPVRPPGPEGGIRPDHLPPTAGGGGEGPIEAACRPASPAALFRVFSAMALQGFGGVLPVAQRVLVDQQRWMTPAQFLETLSVSQVPSPGCSPRRC